MANKTDKEFVNELLMEYIRQNGVLHCSKLDIPNKMAEIAEVSNQMIKWIDEHLGEIKLIS